MKRAKTFRFEQSIVEYLDSLDNQTDAVESAIRNTKAYHNWCKEKQNRNQAEQAKNKKLSTEAMALRLYNLSWVRCKDRFYWK